MPLTLAVELIEPGVRLITLQRPQALNALTTQLLGELADELSAAQADPQT
jgi:enoyl-CoA hydratase